VDNAAHAEMVTLEEAQRNEDAQRSVSRLVIILGSILLMILPFLTTFNEFLTRIVEITGLDAILTRWIVPFETRMIAVILDWIGIPTQVTSSALFLDKGGYFLPLRISWNCVGWQSFILFAATLYTGLQGPFTKLSKVESVVVGFLGTFVMNLLRMTSVAVIAFFFGQLPAVIYHDYGGTVIILGWLFIFWWICHEWLLEPLDELPTIAVEERFLKEIYTEEPEKKASGILNKIKTLSSRIKAKLHRSMRL
jgi:exosortase/archaeosortase family protein